MSDDSSRLYKQNEDQYSKIHQNSARIATLEASMQALKTDLVGVTGNNGFRGEFRQFRAQQEKREDAMITMIEGVSAKLEQMDKAREDSKRWIIKVALGVPGSIAATGGLVIAAMRILS